jgi:elongation factor Ts
MKVKIEDIKKLREKTQASYAHCKEALVESGGNFIEAQKYLTSKGLKVIDGTQPEKGRNGVVKAYVHPGDRVCAAVEISCKTDFVAKTEEFKSFAREIAMQIASMKPKFVSRDDIPFWRVAEEMSFRRDRLEKEGRIEDLDETILGEMEQWYSEVCLLEQTYVRDSKKSIKDILAELVLKTGETCRIERFLRWEVGTEGQAGWASGWDIEECVCEEQEVPEPYEHNRFFTPALIILFIFVFTIFASLLFAC